MRKKSAWMSDGCCATVSAASDCSCRTAAFFRRCVLACSRRLRFFCVVASTASGTAGACSSSDWAIRCSSSKSPSSKSSPMRRLHQGAALFYGLRHQFRALLSRAPGTTRSNASLCLLALWSGEAHRANFLLRASSALCRRTKMWARSLKRRLWSFVRVVD